MGKFAKTRYWDKSYDEKLGWELQAHRTKQVSWNRGTLINTLCTTYKRSAPHEKIFVIFLQDTLQTAFQIRINPQMHKNRATLWDKSLLILKSIASHG